MPSLRDIDRLIDILAILRTPGTGCPWDLKQTHVSLAPYALEEAYEVVDAIERQNPGDLRDELGDYLLQVVFHARVAEESGSFDFGDVVEAITTKMLRRHPHVFPPHVLPPDVVPPGVVPPDGQPAPHPAVGGRTDAGGHERAILARQPAAPDWEVIKAQERARRAGSTSGLLADVPIALPALTRAVKLQAKASTVGFDWNDARLVLAKIREEVDEVEQELVAASGGEALQEEIGDLLFAVGNFARHVGLDPEAAARSANHKFERRFAFIERELERRGSSPREATLAEMEALWIEAKRCPMERTPDAAGRQP